MDLIGRSTVYEDSKHALTLLEKGLNWLFATPSWMPGVIAVAMTIAVIWLLWPKRTASNAQLTEAALPAIEAAVPTPALPIQAPPKPVAIPRASVPKPEPDNVAPKWAPTSQYDLPRKLEIIDGALEIIGSEKECEKMYREAKNLGNNWQSSIIKNGFQKCAEDIERLRSRFVSFIADIREFYNKSEKYDDLQHILNLSEPSKIGEPARNFLKAVENLAPQPPENFNFFVRPYARVFNEAVEGFGRWRFQTEQALLARRKELSG